MFRKIQCLASMLNYCLKLVRNIAVSHFDSKEAKKEKNDKAHISMHKRGLCTHLKRLNKKIMHVAKHRCIKEAKTY